MADFEAEQNSPPNKTTRNKTTPNKTARRARRKRLAGLGNRQALREELVPNPGSDDEKAQPRRLASPKSSIQNLPPGWRGRVLARKLARQRRRGAAPRRINRLIKTATLKPKANENDVRAYVAGALIPRAGLGLLTDATKFGPALIATTKIVHRDLCAMIVGRFVKRAVEPFGHSFKEPLTALALSSDALRDLLVSFPALLFSMAGGYGDVAAQRRAQAQVMAGQSLKTAAAEVDLPLWTRNLPPAAFKSKLTKLPDTARFNRQIGNFIPANEAEMARWLRIIAYANEAAFEDFALWLARYRQWIGKQRGSSRDVLLNLAAYAWFSRNKDTPAGHLVPRPWSPQLGLMSALEHSKDWYEQLLMEYYLGDGLQQIWLNEQRFQGYDFVALRSREDLCHEARAMRNCVRDYAPQLGLNDCRLFSVRKDEREVATVEIRPHPMKTETLSMWQIRGAANGECCEKVKTVAHHWIRAHGETGLRVPDNVGLGDFYEERWSRLWQPYLESRTGRLSDFNMLPNPKLPTKIFQLS